LEQIIVTTYILHGGKTSIDNEQNEKFFGQIAELVNKPEVTVLLCYFARQREKWSALIEKNSQSIKNNTQKKVTFLVAENPKDLLSKIDQADALYVAGGEAELIEPFYQELLGLKEKLRDKVYAGSSMGAFMAAQSYILSADAQEANTIHEGLGLLPIKALCHWDLEPEKEKKLQLLSSNNDLPILVLNEFQSVVMHK
jgi:peptidase E